MAHKFRDLRVWQQAMDLVTDVYRLTHRFPQHEQFGLTSQLRRAAVSIPLNIAEGAGSESPKEFKRFLDIAIRSTYETMTAIEIAVRLDYCEQTTVLPLIDQADYIAAMIVKLSRNIQEHSDTKTVRELIVEYVTNTEMDTDD